MIICRFLSVYLTGHDVKAPGLVWNPAVVSNNLPSSNAFGSRVYIDKRHGAYVASLAAIRIITQPRYSKGYPSISHSAYSIRHPPFSIKCRRHHISFPNYCARSTTAGLFASAGIVFCYNSDPFAILFRFGRPWVGTCDSRRWFLFSSSLNFLVLCFAPMVSLHCFP